MSLDLQEQLAVLRRRIASIDAKFKNAPSRPSERPPLLPCEQGEDERRPARYFVEEYLEGEVVETALGRHFETERLYERHRRHGCMDVSALQELPEDLLEAVSHGTIPRCPPQRWAFLDTETTGLAGGTGTYAFLIGIGRVADDGFRIRQFFMREYGEEASLLHAVSEHLAGFDLLVTYNGKTYDQPLLETRYRMARARVPFGRMQHLDLLHGARRLWKLRIDNCRLVNLESRVLGVERTGDLPGEMIPYVYFEYLRTREAQRIVPILHHNAIDILSLACLTGIVPWAFRPPYDAPMLQATDLVGVGRWLRDAGRVEQAVEVLRRAVERGLTDDLLFRVCWDLAVMEKKRGRLEVALPYLQELSTCRNAHQVPALLELAKHFEHKAKEPALALDVARRALTVRECPEWRKREARLAKRVARKGKLLE